MCLHVQPLDPMSHIIILTPLISILSTTCCNTTARFRLGSSQEQSTPHGTAHIPSRCTAAGSPLQIASLLEAPGQKALTAHPALCMRPPLASTGGEATRGTQSRSSSSRLLAAARPCVVSSTDRNTRAPVVSSIYG